MRKLFLFISFVILLYFSFGFYLATYSIQIYKNDIQPQPHPSFHNYRGVSHVVTSFSKGSSSPSSILLEAAEADLDFLFFTDLNILERPYNISGYQGDVFTFSNQKISYLDSHILIYSQNPDFYFDSMSSANAQLHQHFSEDNPDSQNFLAILAHPFKLNHHWTGPYPKGLDGIEVINMRHLWQQVWFKSRATFIWSLFTYPFNPDVSLLRLIQEPKKELELWDFLNKKSPTLGLLGNETTAKIFNIFGLNFTFPSYEKSFSFASNHILLASELTGHVKSDRKKIFNAFKMGNFYFSFDSLGSSQGFAAYLQVGDKKILMGERQKFSPGTQLHVDLPKNLDVPFLVEVYKNGTLFFKSSREQSQVEIDSPGNYRVIVKVQPLLPLPDRKRWFSWIYTNPFFIQ